GGGSGIRSGAPVCAGAPDADSVIMLAATVVPIAVPIMPAAWRRDGILAEEPVSSARIVSPFGVSSSGIVIGVPRLLPAYRFFSLKGVWMKRRRQVNLAALELKAMLIRSSSDRLILTRCKSHDGKISRSPVTGGSTMAWPVKELNLP